MTTVLVVDDSVANRQVIHDLLDISGYEVLEAAGGEDALVLAHRERPQVVVTDVLMPGMDGYELVRLLREDPDTADVGVVFYSGNYDERELRPIADAYDIDQIVTKSSDPQPLLDAVDAVVSHAATVPNGSTEPRAHTDRDHLRLVNHKLVETVQRLKDSEQRFQAIVESAPVGIVVGTSTGQATYANPAMAAIMRASADDLLDRGWLNCLAPEHHQQALAMLAEPGPATTPRYRDQVSGADRSPQWLDVQLRLTDDGNGTPTGFIAIVEDVTPVVEAEGRRDVEHQRRTQEADWRTSQRMESLRRFAGGAAHDFNNILAIVLAHGEILRETITEVLQSDHLDPQHAKNMTSDLDSILHAADRAAHLTRQLLYFGQRGPAQAAATDINAALEPEIELVCATLRRSITVEPHLAPDLPPVLAVPAQIAQVLRHLASNAADAMPDGGVLRIETTLDVNGSPLPEVLRTGNGKCVRLTVRDTGHGMTPDEVEHAIEPFYTTKSRAQTSGLGLTTVQGIANQSGGDLIIESQPGKGTAVHVILPATAVPISRAPVVATAGARSGGDETVLVVDDEQQIRTIVDRILTAAGYHVLTAADGAQALDLAHRHPGPIHCLLTDLVMPGMPGTELGRRLAEERPDLSILYMSGYAEPLNDRVQNAIPLLTKPFTKATLLAALRGSIVFHK